MQNGWLYTVCNIHTILGKIFFFFKKNHQKQIKFCSFSAGFNCDAAKRTREQYRVKARVFYSCSQHSTWSAFSVAGTSATSLAGKKKVLPCLTEKDVQVHTLVPCTIYTCTSFKLFLKCHDLKYCRSPISKNKQTKDKKENLPWWCRRGVHKRSSMATLACYIWS